MLLWHLLNTIWHGLLTSSYYFIAEFRARSARHASICRCSQGLVMTIYSMQANCAIRPRMLPFATRIGCSEYLA